jgi:hypothetical protein
VVVVVVRWRCWLKRLDDIVIELQFIKYFAYKIFFNGGGRGEGG